MAGERGTVLDSRRAVAGHRRQVQQHREPAAALDERADRGAAEADDEVALPVPGHRAVLSLGRTLTDEDLAGHEVLAAAAGAGARHPQRPARAQACGELAPQSTAALHIQRLVDRLVRDPHRFIMREVEPQPAGDLLRAPRLRPAPVLAPAVT